LVCFGEQRGLGRAYVDTHRVHTIGGEVSSSVGSWTLFRSVIDVGDPAKRSGIVAGTESAREWRGFPEDAVAIGFNTLGDYIVVLRRKRNKLLFEDIFWWDHETCDVEVLADSIDELSDIVAGDP
jgi:hypothetical protein